VYSAGSSRQAVAQAREFRRLEIISNSSLAKRASITQRISVTAAGQVLAKLAVSVQTLPAMLSMRNHFAEARAAFAFAARQFQETIPAQRGGIIERDCIRAGGRGSGEAARLENL